MVAGSFFSAFLNPFFGGRASNLKLILPAKSQGDDLTIEETRDRQDLLMDLMQNQPGLFETDYGFDAALRFYPHRL